MYVNRLNTLLCPNNFSFFFINTNTLHSYFSINLNIKHSKKKKNIKVKTSVVTIENFIKNLLLNKKNTI